jgi:catechol 2,3-dioxygenase-like lactoylglutathione lyase family enzyme
MLLLMTIFVVVAVVFEFFLVQIEIFLVLLIRLQLKLRSVSIEASNDSKMDPPKVVGIGGVFIKSKVSDGAAALRQWYHDNLGIDALGPHGTIFRESAKSVVSSWTVFASDSTYFNSPFMINYRVNDLDRLLTKLREAGVPVDDKVEEGEYGKFGWCTDPEGNRIELWEPPKTKDED